MESTETVHRTIHPIDDRYFIEEVEVNRQKDYWLGRTDSEQKTYLASTWKEALRKTERSR